MQWSRSETLALALQSCTHCYGMGTRIGRLGKTSACKCVFREIFRSCLRKFEEIQRGYSPLGKLDARQNWRASLHQSFGMKNAEYSADFLLVAKRTLGADSLEYKLFGFTTCSALTGAFAAGVWESTVGNSSMRSIGSKSDSAAPFAKPSLTLSFRWTSTSPQ